MKPDYIARAVYISFGIAQFTLSDQLSDEERAAISVARRRRVFQNMTDPVPALRHPLRDIDLQSGIRAGMAKRTIQAVLAETYNTNFSCWKWPEDIWLHIFKQTHLSGPLLTVFAWHLGSVRKPQERLK